MTKHHNGIWVAYTLSLLTPFTLMISGVIAIVYAGYRLDKGEDSDVVNTHYYGLIRTFFLTFTFFVVLVVTVATSNGILVGISDYWYQSPMIDRLAYAIPFVGMVFAVGAIVLWIYRLTQGMQQLRDNHPLSFAKGPNL
ncbi:hypothetical protein [Enterovibrio norvegicus]|uniref:hypothetical protein n=1 Tax=Enterovibrio norvegicus TaxID=188144 RepID=UPI0010BF487B|nr:hypothetical protein [Enterovibrio norvegicus]TKF34418.1 hypothetical protein FCV83_07875 [Enterovibrio norvegicus]